MPITPSLLEVCDTEWAFFRRSRKNLDGSSVVGLKEYEDGAWQRVADYWKFIGGAYGHLTGKDRGWAWSAAFISWCMKEAGAGDLFPYSAGHYKWINRSIKAAAEGGGPLVGHRLNAYTLKPGDLIGYWRGDKVITFDNARTIGWYESHTDIVVEVANGVAYTIGGNVMHSVTKRAVKLNSAGRLIDRRENWFVAIESNL